MTTDQTLRQRNRQAAQQALAAQGLVSKVRHERLNKFIAPLDSVPPKPEGRVLEKRLQSYLDTAGYWTTVVVHAGKVRFYFFDETERPPMTA